MKGKITIFLGALAAAVIAVASPEVPSSESLAILDSLATTAGIVLGVAGAWFALIYPATLAQLDGTSQVGAPEDATYLLVPMALSGSVVLAAILAKVLAPLFSSLPLPALGQTIGLRVVFGGVAFAGLALSWAVLVMAIPAARAETELRVAARRRGQAWAFGGRGTRLRATPSSSPRTLSESDHDKEIALH